MAQRGRWGCANNTQALRVRTTPPRPPAAVDPPPAGEGENAISFSRRTRIRVLQTKATKLLPPKNKGRRSAEKARLSRGASPRIGCCHPYALRAKAARPAGRARLSALHRGARQAVTPRLSPGPRFLEPPGANGRTLPGASAASSSRTGHSAGRAGPRSRPGAECVVPPAGTALAPLSKAPSRRCPQKSEIFLPSKRYGDGCQMRSLKRAT